LKIRSSVFDRQCQTTSNRGTESHGSLWDSRVAEVEEDALTGLPFAHWGSGFYFKISGS